MGSFEIAQRNITTITVKGVVYIVHEDIFKDGSRDYWVKVGPWFSDIHSTLDELTYQLERESPLLSQPRANTRRSTLRTKQPKP